MANTYTPFSPLTDKELMNKVYNDDDATDTEIELCIRLEYWMNHAESLLDEIDKRLAGMRYSKVA